jgi:hypothetical protein
MMNELLEAAKQTQVPIPTIELLLLLVILTISLIFKATRVGLLMAYLFVFRWGWLFFHETLQGQNQSFMIGYLAFGILVVLLSLIIMIGSND